MIIKKILTILILFILLLSACNNQEPTATPEPATAVPPTAEPTAVPEADASESETAVDEEPTSSFTPRYEPAVECFASPPEDLELVVEYDCGYVVVPEFYNGENNRVVKVPFLRFNSGLENAAVTPVLLHPGGPGESHINELAFSLFNIMFDGVIPDRDVIFMDPRGTEHSDTFLDCPAFYSLGWQAYEQGLDQEAQNALVTETLQQCIDDFKAQGINLDAYNSLELAGDVNSVRQALGYNKIIYFGTSYGSILGQHLMRDYPEILEAVILNGSSPLSRQSWIEDRALDNQEALDNLAALCASEAEPGCIEAYPDFPGEITALLEQFGDDPIPYTFTDPNDPSLTIETEITADNLTGLIYSLMGNKNAITSIPATLDSFSQPEQFEALVQLLGGTTAQGIIAGRDLTKGGEALLMHLAVICSDDPVKSEDEIILEGAGEFAIVQARQSAFLYVLGCDLINVQELPEGTDENVIADTPTLLLSGGLDVNTPAVRSELIANALPNATHVIFPGHIHDQLGSLSPCVENVFTQFIADPAATLDTNCVATRDYVGFLLPDGTYTHEIETETSTPE